MKRFLALFLVALMAVGLLASCGAEPEKLPEEPVKILDIESGNETVLETEPETETEPVEDDVDENAPYVRDENKITFGSYPQTLVKADQGTTDEEKQASKALVDALNAKAGALPTSENAQSWTSYGYYNNGSVSNYMWYIDVDNANSEGKTEKYRGVYFTSYRPYYTNTESSKEYSNQDDNGYNTNTVYWFKYEPITWTILSEDTEANTALVLCDLIIDSQEYYFSRDSHTADVQVAADTAAAETAAADTAAGETTAGETTAGETDATAKTVYANNYAMSTIRKWLNENFYETAFDEPQRKVILTTLVDNGSASTGYENNQYACENTEDKIFLLSYEEAQSNDYGLGMSESRQKTATDYARAQGLNTSTSTAYSGKGWWWLRSPHKDRSYAATGVGCGGSFVSEDYYNVYFTYRGVVPALQIEL